MFKPIDQRIGFGTTDLKVVTDAYEALKDGKLAPMYVGERGARFPFEALEDSEITETVALNWLEKRENIDRVASYFDIKLPEDTSEILIEFTTIRLKRLDRPVKLNQGLRNFEHVIVMVPLEDWDESNMWLKRPIPAGGDISMKGNEPIILLGKDTCLLVMFTLNIA